MYSQLWISQNQVHPKLLISRSKFSVCSVSLGHLKSRFIPNYWYLKVNFLGPEKLLWDISSLGWTWFWDILNWLYIHSHPLSEWHNLSCKWHEILEFIKILDQPKSVVCFRGFAILILRGEFFLISNQIKSSFVATYQSLSRKCIFTITYSVMVL